VCFTSDLWTNWSNITDANEEQAMSPTIQEQSEQVQAAAAERLPAEVVATFTHDRKAMLERGTPADAVALGDLLQDFTLPDATGKDVSLSQAAARDASLAMSRATRLSGESRFGRSGCIRPRTRRCRRRIALAGPLTS
jgi:hypothetical protein